MPSLLPAHLSELIEGDLESLDIICEPLYPIGADQTLPVVDVIGDLLIELAEGLRTFCELALAGLEGDHAATR